MSYLSIFLFGTIIGMLASMFLYNYFSRNAKYRENKNLATKDDIAKIISELDELKSLYKNTANSDNEIKMDEIFEAEKEFYESITGNE